MARTANAELSQALESQVDRVKAARGLAGNHPSALEDREFARLMDLIAPRIRHLIHTYRLTDMTEDAQQACAIAVLRALESYDPAQARFTTHVTWQLRGELQSLRHRVRLDQRRSAQSAGVTTVRLEMLRDGELQSQEIVDERALEHAEAEASATMALRLLDGLLDEISAPDHERLIVLDHVLEREPHGPALNYTSEQRRQITRRTYRNCAKVVAGMPPI